MLIISATGILFTGCGEEKKNPEPTTATTAETVNETTAAAEEQTDSAAQTSDGNGAQSGDHPATEGSDGYIDEATAIANVRELVGSGAQIISSEKGYTPEGWTAWIIVVAPVTTSDGPETVTYYSGYQFCYRADSAE
ncbi:MAG: hypothetical protein IJG87_01340 [Ruminococcus sp.]|nr:hypothetical protein [Ruminococcus sp.]